MRSVLAALVLVAAGAATASAQTNVITARTPSRGTTAGGTTVEILVNGWFSSFQPTTVTMGGTAPGCTGALPPTNVVVHGPSRLTFVTPARPSATASGPCTITVTSGTLPSRTATFTYVARTRTGVSGARKPVFSYDGQHVAFESRYALSPTDTNGLIDIYVRNRSTGVIKRVSISTSGGQALGGESTSPAISANGRFVAFQSRATNLVAGDTNGVMDVFVHDRDADGDGVFDEAGAIGTERVNIGFACSLIACFPAQASGGDSADPTISGNGRYVAFHSAATNMGDGDTSQFTDVFVFDRLRRVTQRMSTNANNVVGDGHSRDAAMSLNGRFVVFESQANNLAGGRPFLPPPNASIPAFDIFLHDRDTDEDGIYDESGAHDLTLVSVNPCGTPLTNHSIDPSITYDGNFIVFATVAGNAKVDANCLADDFNGQRDIFIWDRNGDPPTLRRLSEPSNGADLPGASGAPVLSGNGNLLLFRTQAVNAGGASTPRGAIVAAAGEDGKSTTGTVPSPTNDTPPPPDIPPAPPTGSTEEPSTSGDGNTTGSTTEPDPGTGQGEPVIELDETPPDENGTPFIAALSPASGPTAGGAVVEIQGANFVQGQTSVQWDGSGLAFTFVSSSLLRVTTPNGFFDHPAEVRVMSAGEASNEVQYNYVTGLTAPSITSFNPTTATTAGGGNLVITGTNFTAGAVSVRFGSTSASVAPGSTANSITVTIPAAAVAGPVPIVVQNSNGTTAVSNDPFTYTFAPVVAAPAIQPLVPNQGPVTGGTAVTITGTNFTPASTVTIGGVPATDVQVLGNTQIVAVTPAGAEGAAEVVVTTSTGSDTETFTYTPLTPPVLTCTGTDTDGDGMPNDWEIQYGLNPNDATDGALDPDVDLRTNAQECTDLTHPLGLYTRYLAEGNTGPFFDTRVVVANPGATPGRVLFRFQTGTSEVVRHYLVIPAMSRRTIDLRLLSGLEADNVSSIIEADVQLVVDRTMRWDRTTARSGAHAETSAPAPSLIWYLAEGATHGHFDLFYLIQNPSPSVTAQVRVRYLLPAGAPIEQMLSVAPNTRATIHVDAQPGLAATDVSAVIDTLNAVPISVERAMYSSAAGTFAAGHDSAGVTAPSFDWFFAEGATGGFFDTFILLANPNGSAANVRATYLLPSGGTVVRDYTVPANSRRTINVQLEAPELAGTAVSTRLASLNAVSFIAERAMWWPHGQNWTEAHNAAGATGTGTKWAVGDGEVGNLPDDTATYLLIANTSASAGTVRVTLLLETGSPITQDFTVPANSRFNVPVLSSEFPANPGYMRVPRGTRFSAIVESLGGVPAQIVVERAMYWNAAGLIWAAGSDVLATKLQ